MPPNEFHKSLGQVCPNCSPQPHVSQHSYERDQTGLETMTMSYFNVRRLDTSDLELLHKISVPPNTNTEKGENRRTFAPSSCPKDAEACHTGSQCSVPGVQQAVMQ